VSQRQSVSALAFYKAPPTKSGFDKEFHGKEFVGKEWEPPGHWFAKWVGKEFIPEKPSNELWPPYIVGIGTEVPSVDPWRWLRTIITNQASQVAQLAKGLEQLGREVQELRAFIRSEERPAAGEQALARSARRGGPTGAGRAKGQGTKKR
jgi:hypothetical protein